MLSPTLLRWRLQAARILRARKRLEKIGDVELKRRATGEKIELSVEDAIAKVMG